MCLLCFNSAYHFSNEFRKIFGITPTSVRNMK
ncbi:AraC family transcriptional regulator [uncultured Eubacterium sp.]